MMIAPPEIRVTEDRRRDLLAASARARLDMAATGPARSATPRPAGRVRAGLRQAAAALAGLAAIG